MADQNPSEKKSTEAIPGQPVGEKKQTKAIPGKPVEGAELRKETVRINLPPKLGDQAQPGPAPTVRLPGPGATGVQPATVKLTPPTGQTTVMKASAASPKKSDTAQVLTTVLPAPTVSVGEPKPTVKLKAGASGISPAVTTSVPSATGAMTGALTAAAAPMAPEMQAAAPASGFETILSLATAVLAIGVAVVLFLAR